MNELLPIIIFIAISYLIAFKFNKVKQLNRFYSKILKWYLILVVLTAVFFIKFVKSPEKK
jgi:hypothetical protein